MFDIGWSELLVIGVVLIVVVGPKDLPRMLRTFGRTTTQMRKMAGDFRKQFDEALREAELDEVREAAKDLRSLDPTKDIRAAMNPMKAMGEEIRSSLKAATKAPDPSVPSANAPASPVAPSVVGTAPAMPAPQLAALPGPLPATSGEIAPASTSPVMNGSGAHANGRAAGGDAP